MRSGLDLVPGSDRGQLWDSENFAPFSGNLLSSGAPWGQHWPCEKRGQQWKLA